MKFELTISDSRRILTLANEPNEDDVLTFQKKARQLISVSEPAPADYKTFKTWTENLTFYHDLLKNWDSKREAKERALLPLKLTLLGAEQDKAYYLQQLKYLRVGDEVMGLAPSFIQEIEKLQPKIDEFKKQLKDVRAASEEHLEAARAAAAWGEKRGAYPCRQLTVRQPVLKYPLCWFCTFKPTDHAKEAQLAQQVVEVQEEVAQAMEAQELIIKKMP